MANYRKRIKLFSGFHLNISKSGIGFSIGGKGISLSTGKKGTFLNTSLPGTGIYQRTKLDINRTKPSDNDQEAYDSFEDIVNNDPLFSALIKLLMEQNPISINDVKSKLFIGTNRAKRLAQLAFDRGFLIEKDEDSLTLKPKDEIAILLKEYEID